ncbi:MAG: enoyl-ACP reductase [bacterium]
MPSMQGKKALVVGVANERSIAWGIAKRLADEGAQIALTYQGEVLEKRVRPLAESISAALLTPCDVASDADIDAAFGRIRDALGGLDVLVHSVAYARREDLTGDFVATDREGFRAALDISVYSLVALTRAALPLFEGRGGGSVLTLSYYGAEKALPHYNVMGVAKAALEAAVRYLAQDLGPRGIRVNAISAGPIKTLAAAGIHGFRDMLHHHEERALLKRNVTADEVGAAALALLGPLGTGITGEVLHVDAGYHATGM